MGRRSCLRAERVPAGAGIFHPWQPARRVPRAQARALLARNLPEIWIAGAVMCTMLTLPLVNLAIPVIGAATFTHLFHRVWR